MREIFIRFFPNIEPRYEDVYQLDVVSVYDRFTYNLFFYVTDDMPDHLVVCMLRRVRSVSVDVMRLEEVKQRLQEQTDRKDASDRIALK